MKRCLKCKRVHGLTAEEGFRLMGVDITIDDLDKNYPSSNWDWEFCSKCKKEMVE